MRRGVAVRVANELQARFGTEQIVRNIAHAGADASAGKIITAIRQDWAGESSAARTIAAKVTNQRDASKARDAKAERLAEARRIKDEQQQVERERFEADQLLHRYTESQLHDLIAEAVASMDQAEARLANKRVAQHGARDAALMRPLRPALLRVVEARQSGELRIVPDPTDAGGNQ